ncbi:MAG: ATP-binding protein [Eubacterium sp.]|nr:ATP-binding protein [Eubacterium sp.]MCC8174090.1 ATP-binding protein [Odoribacter sp.]
MLLEFSCSNHKSIRDKIVFSAVAGSDTTFEDKTKEIAGVRVLKSSVIYGANGSGKSNFVDAISFVKNLVLNSINHQPGQGINQRPHKLESTGKESMYQIHFIVKNIRYVYGFSLKNLLVDEEYLYYFPNRRQAKIFDRKGNEYTVGSRFKGKFGTCKDVLKPNRLMLSCAANFTSIAEISDVFKFFSDELVIYSAVNQDNWMNYSLYQMNTNEEIKKMVLSFMQNLGMGIKDIKVSIDQKQMEDADLPPFLSDEFKNLLLQTKVNAISAKVLYDKFETDLMQDESMGVKKLFGLLCPIIDILVHGKVLICDELESSLHESIVYQLVRTFINSDTDNFAQIIFTTHETGLLNLDLFRRDQIWFTELEGTDRYTDLYSLAEIKNVRKDENFGKGYITGKYGAIPMLNVNFANIISEL